MYSQVSLNHKKILRKLRAVRYEERKLYTYTLVLLCNCILHYLLIQGSISRVNSFLDVWHVLMLIKYCHYTHTYIHILPRTQQHYMKLSLERGSVLCLPEFFIDPRVCLGFSK